MQGNITRERKGGGYTTGSKRREKVYTANVGNGAGRKKIKIARRKLSRAIVEGEESSLL